jgi:site-specific DNA-cytosine methylase
MHTLPIISDLSWARLALIPPGGDHRDLPDAGELGKLLALKPSDRDDNWQGMPGLYGVLDPNRPAHSLTANMSVSGSNTPAAVADARFRGILTSPLEPGQKRREQFGRYNIADWLRSTPTVDGPGTNGAYGVADIRPEEIRLVCTPRAGVLGVVPWNRAIGTITANARIDNGAYAVPDPRADGVDVQGLPIVWGKGQRGRRIPIIISRWGAWHRPMTPLEMAVLQDFPAEVDGKPLELPVDTREEWGLHIGNAVPPGAGRAIGNSLLKALLATKLGTWFLDAEQIWVRGPEREDLDGLDAPMVAAGEREGAHAH